MEELTVVVKCDLFLLHLSSTHVKAILDADSGYTTDTHRRYEKYIQKSGWKSCKGRDNLG